MLEYKSIWYNPTLNSVEFKTGLSKYSPSSYYYVLDDYPSKRDIGNLSRLCRTDIAYDIEIFIRKGVRKGYIKVYPIPGRLYE